ncbi:MAG: hypothetical protein FWF28_10050 [Micrococcales bacterium]|nr:hypothetical protein [Micrococcales bacterium]
MSGAGAGVGDRAAVIAGRRLRDPRTWPWWGKTLGVYAVSRVLTAAVFLWVAGYQKANTWTGAHPSYFPWVGLMFDGSWYQQIALHGYPSVLPVDAAGTVQQNAWAFFPLYPALARGVMVVTRLPWEVAAPLLSTVLAGGAMLAIHRCVAEGAPRAVARWPGLPLATVLVVCVFPTSPVLQTAYTESLALLLIAVTLLALLRHRYAWAGLLMVLLGLSRAVAMPMAAVVVIHAAVRWWDARQGRDRVRPRTWAGLGALTAVAVASGFLWPAICGWWTGNPEAYVLTQESWRGLHSVQLFIGWTYVPQFWFGGRWPLVVIPALAFTAAVILAPSAFRLGRELHVWAAAYVVYLAGVVEPGSSLARFLLLAFPLGAATVGAVGRTRRGRAVWLAFVVLAMGALQVLWIRQIWLFNPTGDWPP